MSENHNGTMEIDGDLADDDLASDKSIDGSDELDSDEDDAQQKEWEDKKLLLQEKIRKDKTDYYAYIQLIEVLEKLSDLDELRKAREDFSAQYPLSPELWLSWIENERNLVSTAEEKEHVKNLFERAIRDYNSVEIWLEYAQFSIGLMSDNNQVETVRSIMERALSVSGLHASKGNSLWEVYREFEMIVLLSLKEANPSGEETEEIKSQKKRIAEIHRRQLSIPLIDMENTYQELRHWIEEEKAENYVDMESLENGYKKALEKLSKILTFEESLICSEIDARLPIYQNYLEFEKRSVEGGNNHSRVICLYERAITDIPLHAPFWYDYIEYSSTKVKVPEDIISVCQRAVRNCPGEAALWRYYMEEMERINKPKNEITDVLSKSLENVYSNPQDYKSLWLVYIRYLIRYVNSISQESEKIREAAYDEVRSVVNMAFENLTNYFGLEGDPDSDVLLLWTRFEAEIPKDLERYRKIWTDILNLGHNKSSAYWIKYIDMEWQYGDAKHFRKLCERALNALVAVPENPQRVVSQWLEYESVKGSLDSFLHCRKICEEKIKQFHVEKEKLKEAKEKKKPQMKDNKKAKPDGKVFAKPEPPEIKDAKTHKAAVKNSLNEPAAKQKVATPVETPSSSSTYVSHDPLKNDRTVFISNLEYTVTEEDVKKLLSTVGIIEEFRLAKDYKGRSKGFGYMVFSSKEAVAEALKKDRTPINERPMFISECDPDRVTRKTGLRFHTGLEKNKLFVKGLPLDYDKKAVEGIFNEYGILKDVRLVTYRNGHSKGLAYVEFEDEASAAHALLKTDGLMVKDKLISVAISNPPERKNNPSLLSISDIALGGGPGDKNEFGQRGRGRTQLSFLPRAVKVTVESNKMDVSDGQSASKKSMTNEDFKALLNKK